MSRKLCLLLVLAALLLAFAGCSQDELTRPEVRDTGTLERNLDTLGKAADSVVPSRHIVMLQAEAGDASSFANDLAGRFSFKVDQIYTQSFKGFAGTISETVAEQLRAVPGVLGVEPDRRVAAMAQNLPTGIDRIQADLSPVAAIDGQPNFVDVDIAIIDTGLDMVHPDLNVVGGVRILGGLVGSDFIDDFGHGTHLGGIAAARDNSEGAVGMAPGARLWGVKVLDGWGLGLLSDVIAGVDWVTARSGTIEVATLCLGATGYSPALRAAVQNCVQSGVIVVAAAGNGAQDIFGSDGVFGTGDDIMPASFLEVATITALVDADGRPGGFGGATTYGPDDSFALFSNFAHNVLPGNPVVSPGGAIDLILPGVAIRSTIPGNRYYTASGTSMAAAHAAGLFALHIAGHGRADNATEVAAIRQAVIDNAVAQGDLDGLVVQNDPDARKEPIGWAIPSGPYADVAVTLFTGPASVLQGDPVVLTVTLANLGSLNAASPFEVTITESGSGAVLVSRTINALPAGAGGSATVTLNVPAATAPGFYTLVCAHDYTDPIPANDRRELVIEVRDDSPIVENLGIFFDTAASLTQVDGVDFADHVTAYILYNNPSIAATRGFECGIDIVYAGKEAQIITVMSVTYPVPWVDVGISNGAAGTYNYITGYTTPIPTTIHTVMATLDIFYLEIPSTQLDFYLRASIPESGPDVGLPTLLREDFTELKVAMASDPYLPAMQINVGKAVTGTIVINPDPDSLDASLDYQTIIPIDIPTGPGVPDLNFMYQ